VNPASERQFNQPLRIGLSKRLDLRTGKNEKKFQKPISSKIQQEKGRVTHSVSPDYALPQNSFL
ncbi:hypothetical protein, partial [Alloprevotella tannerae]|uniref:hypothetical protein n=1 Tax=Alloprevotella tannerae TaxID=76122 RepID=UPI0026ED8C88